MMWRDIEQLADDFAEAYRQGYLDRDREIAMCEDCISKASVISELSLYRKTVEVSITPKTSAVAVIVLDTINDCIKLVGELPSVVPTIEVMEYPQVEGITPTLVTTEQSSKVGEWIDKDGWKFCSECGNRADAQANGAAIEPRCTNYCCECGAKMNGAGGE